MGFEDLEILLKTLFQKARKGKNAEIKRRVRLQVMEAFSNRETESVVPLFGHFFAKKSSRWAFAVVSFFVLFNILPNNIGLLSAGQVKLKHGVVEVIRGGNEVILVTDYLKLKKGDLIRVGNNGEAEIIFPDSFSSVAKSQTELRVLDEDSLFLINGKLENQIFTEGEVSTNRGFVKSMPGASFQVIVSKSGETSVISEEKQIVVSDWKNGETVLEAGNQVRLSSDTVLVNENMPTDLSLSMSQLKTIEAKEIITRSKVLTALENYLDNNETQARKDLASARKSFLSIMNVPSSSRNLKIIKRKDLDSFTPSDVVKILEEKIPDSSLVTEAKALEVLMSLTEQNIDRLGFVVKKSGVRSFDSYVLLDRIAAFGNGKQKRLIDVLKQKYAVAFLQKVQDEELRIDQISKLSQEISKLPRTELAMEFLEKVQDLFAPDLAEMLEEKMDKVF
ncbi:hypothetical protein K9M41_01285 [Candidatus Gracilibacteria bacterium]|nr:hypothetical protein [Candidatus Gracilibacteria bacterium]